MIKVLYVVDGSSYGGIGKFCNDVRKNISGNIKIDILSATDICKDWYNLGISRKTILGKIKYNYRLNKFLKDNHYDIIHINTGVFLYAYQVVKIAKKRHIKTIIVHSHSIPYCSSIKKAFISLLRPIFNKRINIKFACSSIAAESLFGSMNNVLIINNGICIDDYKFNEELRKKYRNEFKIGNSILYGYIGAFTKYKNQKLLVDVFNVIKDKQDAKLMLIGDGSSKKDVENLVDTLGIKDKVLFLGNRNDANKLLNAMDVFVFPSIREGLGLVGIEAQANGLLTYCSEYIPKEANVSPYFKVFNTNNDINSIAEDIYCDKIDISKRDLAYKYVKDNGFDIKYVCKVLESIYRNIR